MAHVLINSAMGCQAIFTCFDDTPWDEAGSYPWGLTEGLWPGLGLQRLRVQCVLKGAPANWFLRDLEPHRLGR